MAQSVELVLDPAADAVVTAQWRALAEAGLPTAQRSQPSDTHCPHITLFAGDVVPDPAEEALYGVVDGLDLTVLIGAVMLFGPRRDSYVVVRQVTPSAALLDLQARVATMCDADPGGQFGAGRWSPHVTLARRARSYQIGPMLEALGRVPDLTARVTACRRWDGEARRAWWLTPPVD